ncbi:MAG TPA: PAS domain S-box protein [Candidatus Methylomirabilis sp.]|nr:PAS domain S-box protein [Candidatus Methylomirabilis sp.]
MGLLRRVSLLCALAFLALAAILGALITRAFKGNATDAQIWTILLVGFAALYAVLYFLVRKSGMFADQRDLSRQLLSLMNNVPGAVYRGLPDWTMPMLGADIERFIGYPAEEFSAKGKRWLEVIHPDDIDRVKGRIREAVRNRERVLRLEYRLRHRDGSVCWVGDRRQMIYGEDGRLRWVDGLLLDITDRKRSETALHLTQFSVDRGGDAAYWMGPDGCLLYVNDKACEALGYSREELLSMKIQEINPDFPSERWPSHWEELRQRRTYSVESKHRTKDGRLIPVEVTANYIEFDGKEYNCASAHDITARKRAEEESRLLQSQLIQAQKMEALGLLAGGIAHDFNNLLTGILGYANLLCHRKGIDPEVDRAAVAIQRASERASNLTAQLLGFARKGKNLNIELDLGRMVTAVTGLLERTLDQRIRIVTAFLPEGGCVLGDPSQLDQVVMNLAVNACDAMPDGGRLKIATERVFLDEAFCRDREGMTPGNHILLSVGDTGIGIPPENLERIFDPFFTTKPQGKGTGLGLSMVFGIVRNHGGCVDVRSEAGAGTEFRVYLPESGAGAPKETVEMGGSLPRGRGRILLVDDQETVREVARDMLEALGYEVITACDGLEGVSRYRELWREIDLVVVDMVMPNLSGGDCFRRMKEINPKARVVLSSGYSMEGAIQDVMREGILAFIQKPYHLEELSRVVGTAVGTYQ